MWVLTLEWYCVYTSVPSVIVRNANLTKLEAYTLVLLPEAVLCCLQTCNCGFDSTVVLCTSVPSLIVGNGNTTKL